MSNEGQNPDDEMRPDEQDGADATHPPRDTGFRMLDWLTMPNEERELVIWLTRRRRATHDDILAAFGGVPEIDTMLQQMLDQGYIQYDGELFTVVYRTHQKRSTREFPDDIWSRVDAKYSRKNSGDQGSGA